MVVKSFRLAIAILLLHLTSVNFAHAQWIQSINLVPSNPSSTDTIRAIVNSDFPSGGCDQSSEMVLVNGNNIDAYTIHCLGVLSFICNDTDTFLFGPLPSGNYTFRLQLDMGGLPSPCTPGIIPVQTDSISFVVGPATGTGEYISSDEITLSPNPASGFITVRSFSDLNFPLRMQIFSVDGKKAGEFQVANNLTETDIRFLPAGHYHVQLTTAAGQYFAMPLIISR